MHKCVICGVQCTDNDLCECGVYVCEKNDCRVAHGLEKCLELAILGSETFISLSSEGENHAQKP